MCDSLMPTRVIGVDGDYMGIVFFDFRPINREKVFGLSVKPSTFLESMTQRLSPADHLGVISDVTFIA